MLENEVLKEINPRSETSPFCCPLLLRKSLTYYCEFHFLLLYLIFNSKLTCQFQWGNRKIEPFN